jgi:hypothetical protein
LERVVTVELLWLRKWRLELIESIAELEEYELPESAAPNGPSNSMALKWTREELQEVERRIARAETKAVD